MTWRLGRRVGGPLAGLATLLLLALCPTFYGHMFMNPKDAPFAVSMVILMLGLVRLAQEYPQPSPRTILIVGLGAGLSIGSRILGGLALIYAMIGFAPLLLEEFRSHGLREAVRRFAHVVYVLLPGLVFGYLVMGLIWPWSIMEPVNPFRALTYFSHFFEKPWKEMFDGALVSVPDMPWSYLPTLFALQLPEVLLVLCVAAVVGTFMSLSRTDVPARRKTIFLMLTLAATLPLVMAMVKRPALYNGIRHFIFVIPPMAVLAGAAFAWGMNWLKHNHRRWQPVALAVFTFGLMLPLGEMIRLHPYQYTHFNYIAGTVRSADNLFMLDYWGLALKQASDGLREELVERQEFPPAQPQMEGRGMRTATPRPGRARSRLHDRLGLQCRRLRDDARRILLQGPDRPGHGGNQARRRGVCPGLRHPRPEHFQPAGDSRAIRQRRLSNSITATPAPRLAGAACAGIGLRCNQPFRSFGRNRSCRQRKLA